MSDGSFIKFFTHPLGNHEDRYKFEVQYCSLHIRHRSSAQEYIFVSVLIEGDHLCLSSNLQPFHLCRDKKTMAPKSATLWILKHQMERVN